MTHASDIGPRSAILVVDDDLEVCETFRDILELVGYDVTLAHRGWRALELCSECDFDVVLMDIKMPGMDGVETLRRLRQTCPRIPVIMITAYAMPDRIDEALRIGATAALRKPVRVQQLLEIIAAACPRDPEPPDG